MDNGQLWLDYNKANSKLNVFDRVLALQEFDKEYKKSDFYKQTKMSIKDFQQYCIMFRLHDILDTISTYADVDGLGEFFTEVLDAMDSEVINNFFGRIVDAIDPKSLAESSQVLQSQIAQLRK